MQKSTENLAVGQPMSDSQANAIAKNISKANTPDNPVVEHLQRQLANAFILYMNYKRYHWQTYGPLFRDLHLLFDEFGTAVLETIDEFAERVRMIGQDPISGPQELLATTSVQVAQRGQSMREMIEEANRNALVVIKEMRAAVRAAEKADDPGSVDLFSRHIQVHEKHEWWLRDLLEKRDGLTA